MQSICISLSNETEREKNNGFDMGLSPISSLSKELAGGRYYQEGHYHEIISDFSSSNVMLVKILFPLCC